MPQDTFHERLDALLPEGVRVDAMLRFRDDVLRFNRGRNLVSRGGGPELVERLVVESAGAATVLRLAEDDRVLDLGTGAGFPGIPFSIVRSPAVPMALLDRRPAACDFLRRELRELEIEGVEVLEGQSGELLAQDEGLSQGFSWVLMKAVAPPEIALTLARPFLRPGACAVIFRDQGYRPEAAILAPQSSGGAGWEWEGGLPLPGFDPGPGAPAIQLFRKLAAD